MAVSKDDDVNEVYEAIIRTCCCCGAGLGMWHHPYCVYGLTDSRTPVYEHQTRKTGGKRAMVYRIKGEDDGGLSLVPEEEGDDAGKD